MMRKLIPVTRLALAALILLSSLAATPPAAHSAPLSVTATPRAIKLSGVRPGGVFNVDYVEVPYSPALNSFGLGITLEAWVKRNDATRTEAIVCNGWQHSYCLSLAGSKLRLSTGNADFMDSLGNVPAGAWVHVAATYDRQYQKLYINGVLDNVRALTAQVEAASNTPLGIGVDLVNDFMQNYFAGQIDNVRVFDYARSADELRAMLFQAIGGNQSGLIAEWRLDGNGTDSTTQHNGILHSSQFVDDGAIPHDLRAPLTNAALTVDGVCNTGTEYASAPHVMAGLATAYLVHTSTDLWVCLDGLEEPTNGHDNWAVVTLDPNWSRDQKAQPSDLSLEAHSDGSLRARAGDGSGGYTVTTAANGHWNAFYRAYFNGFVTLRSAEFRISQSLLGGQVIGLGLGQQWVTAVDDNRLWPALAKDNSPATWSVLTLGGNGVSRTFTGKVLYQPRNPIAAATGILGAGVDLIGSDPNGGESVVATAASAQDGSFTLHSDDDYTHHRLVLDTPSLPQGYVLLTASSPNGTPVDARTIDFDTAGAGTYANNLFTLGDTRPAPPDTTVAPYFLIVASQQVIDAGALTDFVDFKRRLGFQVEVASVEYAEQTFSGASRLQKIRNLEINRHNAYGSRFRYVMLVGWDTTIPIGHVGIGYPGLLTMCQAVNNWPTEWFYADLVSNWDTNGNGCWADVGDPNDQANHPADDPTQAYHLTVAVGRIPFEDAGTVRQVLSDSMAFEQQSGDFKQQTLLAESMLAMKADSSKGWCWLPYHDANGKYYNEGDTYLNKPVHCSDYLTATGTDSSYLGHAMQVDWLNANNYGSTTLYENMPASVGGSPYSSGTTLSPAAVAAELNGAAHGLVHIGGHGSADGVGRTYWIDATSDGAVQASTPPTANNGNGEIYQTELLETPSLGGIVKGRAGQGAVFVLAACETGFNEHSDNFATQLLSHRVAVAWVGALSTAPYTQGWSQLGQGGMSDYTYGVSRRILVDHARLGDAAWEAMSAFIANGKAGLYGDPRYQLFDLFGDPTLSYWGNPGGDSTDAPWPMMRQNAFGQGRTSLSGPGVPQQRWSYTALARVLDTIPPSPIVSNKNEVIAAHGSFVDVLLGGTKYQRLTLNQPAFGTPALAADGTVYALDRPGRLYAFAPAPCVPQGQIVCTILLLLVPKRSLRWSVDLGGVPLGSPIVGPNGFVYVPVEDGEGSAIVAVRPDGFLWKSFGLPNDQVVGSVAAAGSRIYATTAGGALVRVTPDGVGCTNDCFLVTQGGAAFTTPPLLANGSLYAGRSDGTLARFNLDSLAQQASFAAGSVVTMGPVLGPGGQVVMGTQAGTVYGLWSSLGLRWQHSFGGALRSVPAASADAVYIGSGDYLYALDPFSGAVDWLGYLGAGGGGGSAAVGYGREVYVQTGAGPIVAIGEGWAEPPINMQAMPYLDSGVGGGTVKGMVVQWALAPEPAAAAAPSQAETLAGSFLLQRSSDGEAWQDVAVLPPGTEVYTDTAVSDDTLYRYRVQTLSASGHDSDFATMPISVLSLPALPAAPTVISISVQAADQIDVAWQPAAGSSVSGYRLERSLSAVGPFVTDTVTSGGVNAFSDGGLLPGTTYFYRVIATNDTGDSPPSNVASATTRTRSLTAPQNVFAVVTDENHVHITWVGAPGGATAVVEFNPRGSTAYRFLGTTGPGGPFDYQEINPNSYGYRVKFVQGNNESAYGVSQLRLFVGVSDAYQVLLPLIAR